MHCAQKYDISKISRKMFGFFLARACMFHIQVLHICFSIYVICISKFVRKLFNDMLWKICLCDSTLPLHISNNSYRMVLCALELKITDIMNFLFCAKRYSPGDLSKRRWGEYNINLWEILKFHWAEIKISNGFFFSPTSILEFRNSIMQKLKRSVCKFLHES